MTLFLVCFLAAALFVLLMISLGFQPKFLSRITGALLLITAAAGVFFYGYGYAALMESLPQAVTRTLFSVFSMFLGRNEIGVISAVPALASPLMQILIYAVHLLALFCTASAVIASMGTRLQRVLHLLLLRRGELHLIYGAGEESLAFGRALTEQNRGVVVFVDRSGAMDGAILRMGSLLFSDGDALAPNAAFLRRIGMHRSRRIALYCLRDNTGDNLRYAAAMARALGEGGVPAENATVSILLEDESQGAALQAGSDGRGFGSVLAISRWDLAGRMMIRTVPPWEYMRFDGAGRAREDFEALIVGFGRTGQAVLRSLVMNGQYAGSRFRCTVVARDADEFSGDFRLRSPEVLESYDIRFINGNAHSAQVYRHLTACSANLNYVAICTGTDKENEEVAAEYARLLNRLGCRAPLLLCTPSSVRHYDPGAGTESLSLFSPAILCPGPLDDRARLINHQYHLSEGRTAQEDWARCDYFSRMSCRASADFLPAFLFAAGITPAEAMREGFAFPPETLENLGETEHMRWCAFHRVMGYRAMSGEEFRSRAEARSRELEEKGASSIRIGKDTVHRLHACLIPWEELDALSEREEALTGRRVDYKEMDRDNVRSIPAMLRTEEGHE